MSRSPYYPRKRPRILSTVEKQIIENARKSGSDRIIQCVVCHLDVPVVSSGGLEYVQEALGFICEETDQTVCPFRFHLAARAAEEWHPPLSPARFWPEIYPTPDDW